MTSIAILGAGSSGLAAAHTLRDAGHVVTLFEQSRDVGGRATTRKSKGFTYDSGAQYIKPGSLVSISLVTERFRASDLIDISKPVWIFDGTGRIQEGDPLQNAEPKWCYRSGLITLAQRMAEGLDIRFETPVHHIQQTQTGWSLFDTSGQQRGQFEQLLVTLPAPQARELIAASPGADDLRTAICSQLDKAHYNPLLSVMLGYRSAPRLRPYYALVNTDKAHAISWLAWEHEKAPERVPEGTGLLIAQMAPQYSHEQWHTPDEALVQDVAQRVAALIDEHLPTPIFTDVQHWRYALPSERADASAINALALPYGLAFCGDAFVGGRVHLALEHGIGVAQQMIASLQERRTFFMFPTLPEDVQNELEQLAQRYGQPLARTVDLEASTLFDPLNKTDRYGEVCMVIRRKNGLLLTMVKTIYPKGAYRLPTGGINYGESIRDALLRETYEETGLQVNIHRFLAAVAYRVPAINVQPIFYTFAFLLDEVSGTLGAIDETERVEAFHEIEPSELPEVAETLASVKNEYSDEIDGIWRDWGHFRAVIHRAVWEALQI